MTTSHETSSTIAESSPAGYLVTLVFAVVIGLAILLERRNGVSSEEIDRIFNKEDEE